MADRAYTIPIQSQTDFALMQPQLPNEFLLLSRFNSQKQNSSINCQNFVSYYLRNCKKNIPNRKTTCNGYAINTNRIRMVIITQLLAYLNLSSFVLLCTFVPTFMSKYTTNFITNQYQRKRTRIIQHGPCYDLALALGTRFLIKFLVHSTIFIHSMCTYVQIEGPSWVIAFIGGQINNLKSA